ncbi:hypothetical protein CM15mP43_10250 [bacterium]|nr:MAG: hypothetical protein CM15mP43_10250 [bacterium]
MIFIFEFKEVKGKNLKEKILSISTIGGAKCLGLDKKIGSIEINKRADLLLLKLKIEILLIL